MINVIFQKQFSYYCINETFGELTTGMIYQIKTIQIITFNQPFKDHGRMYASRK